jgi:niacin transporter
MCAAALLIAIGFVIPVFSPVKILLEPASYTLASHVSIFIAMFISPFIAVVVSLGTTLGFLVGGFPPVIVLRAATHEIGRAHV